MKKLSLLFVFVLALVMILAFNTFAATPTNIENDAVLREDGGCGSVSAEMVRDNDVNTGASCGTGPWVNFHFLYENGAAISKVEVVVNSTGNVYSDTNGEATSIKEYTSISNLPNIYLRLYSGNDKVYVLENQPTSNAVPTKNGDTVLYTTYVYDFGETLYKNVTKVEVATVHNNNTSMAIWEVSIYGYSCSAGKHQWDKDDCEVLKTCALCKATSEGHSWLDATCQTPKTCNICKKTEGEPLDYHAWVDATCSVAKHCSVCGLKDGEPTGVHNYTLNMGTTDPTCAQGYTTYGCTTCDKTEKRDFTDAIYEHDYKYFRRTIKLPTVDEEGQKEYVCAVCSGIQVVSIPKVNHNELLNIASWSTITVPKGCWVIGGELFGHPTYNAGRMVDGDYGTGVGGGHQHPPETSVFFTFDKSYVFEKVVLWFNQTPSYDNAVSQDYNLTNISKTEPNKDFEFTVCFYDEGGNKIFQQSYRTLDVECIEIPGLDVPVKQIEYWLWSSYDNSKILWEVEAFTVVDPHAGGTATCEEKAVCSTCDQEYGEFADHTWGSAACTIGNCVICGAENPNANSVAHGKYSWQKGGCEVCGTLDEKFYKIVYADDINDITGAPDGSVVIVTAEEIKVTNNTTYIKNAVLVDLRGNKIMSTHSHGGIYLDNADIVLVNGTVEHDGGVAAIKIKGAKTLADLTIKCTSTSRGSIICGFQVNPSADIKLIDNVTFNGDGLGVGIEMQSGSHIELITESTIEVCKTGSTQDAQHQHVIGIIVKGQCDSITNSTITASYSSNYTLNQYSNNTGIYIENGNAIKLSNCTVNAEEQAIYVNSNSANLTFENTTFGGAGALINSSVAVNGLTDVAVATIGNKYFATLEKAIAAVNADETVKLVKNIDLATAIEVDKVATIDLNGKKLTVSEDTAGDGVFMVVAGGELTINATGGGEVNGVGKNIYNIAIFANGGKVVINGGTYTNIPTEESGIVLTDDHYDLIYVKNGGIVEIKGGTFIAQTPKWTLNVCDKTGGSFVVTGGTFPAGFNPGATETEPNGANNDFIPAGYYLNGNTVEECKSHELTELTCTESSVCTICQYVDAVATGHTMADATCTAPKTCTACGATEGAALGHSWQNATCTTAKTCSVCKTTDGEPLGHKSDVPATCQNPATCLVCGNTFGSLDPNAHTSVVTDAAVSATCTATGLTEGKHCSACNTVIVAQQTTDKLSHTEGTPATCTSKAVCSVCSQEYGEFAAHTYGTAVCNVNTCVACGYVNSEITAEKHTYGWNIGTKIVNGEEVQMHGCSVCKTEAKKDGNNNYSTNLGFKIYYVASWSEFTSKVNSSDAAVVRFTADATTNSAYEVKNGNVIIDLGGFSVTSTAGSATFHLNYAKGLVNGTLYEGGAKQAVSVRTAEFIKDFVIEVIPTAGDCSGIIIFPGRDGRKTYLGLIENVTITAKNNGIETYETITGADTVIGTIDGVTITTPGQALTLYSNVGIIKNSTLTGKNFAVIFKYLNGTVTFENCTLSGDNACLYVNDIKNNAKLVVDSATTFATKGLLFYATEAHKDAVDFGMLETAVAAVNGRLYATFAEAFAALKASSAEDATEFALMANLELSSAIVIEKNVNFSLGGGKFEFVYEGTKKQEEKPGYNITMLNDTEGNGAFWVKRGGKLTLSGAGVVNSVGNNKYNIAVWADGGEVIINGGTYTNIPTKDSGIVLTDDHYDLIYVKNGGSVVINGGTFKAQTPKWTLNLNDTNGGTILVNDGIFYGFDPSKVYSEPNAPVSFVSDDVICVYENADGAYVLASKHLHDHTSQQTNTGCIETNVGPTCTEYGYRTHTCPCGDIRIEKLTDNDNKPTGHTSATIDAVPPTCTSTGLTEGSYCSVCKEVLTAQTVVPATGHAYDDANDATCNNGCGYVRGVAYIGETYYATFAEALKAAVADDTIVLLAPVTVAENMTIDKSGITITSTGDVFVVTSGTLTINGNITVNAGTSGVGSWCAIWANGGNVVINAGTYSVGGDSSSTEPDHQNDLIYTKNNGTVTINGGTFKYTEGVWTLNQNDTTGGAIVVNGGIFENFNPANAGTELDPTYSFLAPNACMVKVENNYVVVNAHTEETIPAVDATCTETGLTAGVKCSVCNVVLTAPETVPATDHNWNSGTKIDGGIRYTCIACGEFKDVITRGTAVDPIKISLGENRFMYYTAEADAVYYYVQIAEAGTVTVEIDKYAGIKLGLNPELMGDTPFMSGSTSYTFEIQEAGNVVIAISLDYIEYTPPQAFTVSFEKKPVCEHTNTEIIPAVLPAPSNNHTGRTEGLYCLDCETTIVEQVESVATSTTDWNVFGVQNMSLALSNNIAINYNINISDGYNNIYMVFVYEGEEYIYTEYTEVSSNKVIFKFDKTRPHKMSSNVDAYLYGTTADGYVVDTIPGGYSIMKYCQQAIDAYKGHDDVFVKLIYDLVAYGAAVQKYENKNISDDELVTTLMEKAGYELEVTEFTGIENASSIVYVDEDPTKLWWNDVQLMLGSSTVLYYNFDAPNIDGITIKVEYSDQTIIFENKDIVSLGNNKYRIEIDTLASTQYVYDVKATFITADGVESSSMTWSINGYLDKAVEVFTGETKELIERLYIYGESIRAYFNE